MSEASNYYRQLQSVKARREQEKFLLPIEAKRRKSFRVYRWCSDHAIAKHVSNGYKPVLTKDKQIVRDNELVLMCRWNTWTESRQHMKNWFVEKFDKLFKTGEYSE